MGFITDEWKGTEFFKINDFHHIEYLVGNAKQAVQSKQFIFIKRHLVLSLSHIVAQKQVLGLMFPMFLKII